MSTPTWSHDSHVQSATPVATETPPPGPFSPEQIARLKIALLAEGLRLSAAAREASGHSAKPALRVRSGSCGGLDVILPLGVTVNCPIYEGFALTSRYVLTYEDERFFITRRADNGNGDGGELRVPVELVPCPAYYHATARSGKPLSRYGQLCADRLGIGITNNCYYWRTPERRCKFCSIGLNLKSEQRDKWVEEITEVADAAFADEIQPARHVLLGGGTPDGPDSGAIRIAEGARALKARWDRPIYAMIVPPQDDAYIDLLKESGVDELGMNIEIFDPVVAEELIPGKYHEVGLERYRTALEHAVKVFGPVNTRSIMVVGLEPLESTVRGVEWLASMGVMPILSPFRPMAGTELEHHPRLSAEALWDVTQAAAEAAGKHGMPLGPTCIPCQENTLNLPGHPAYHYY